MIVTINMNICIRITGDYMTPLNKQAFLHLKNMIINNELSYLEIYSETKLSKELGISRTPFRDAIHRLAQEG